MAEYRTIKMSFWSDPYIEELPAHAKLLYLYLFTSSHTNNLGVLEITRRKMANESGLDLEEVNSVIDLLTGTSKVAVDGHKTLVIKFIKNQTATSKKMIIGLRHLLAAEESPVIRGCLIKEYPKIFNGIDTHRKGMDAPSMGMDTHTIPIPEYELEVELEDEKEDEEEKELDTPSEPFFQGESPLKNPPPKLQPLNDPDFQAKLDAVFDEFWEYYPKKQNRKAAKAEFSRLLFPALGRDRLNFRKQNIVAQAIRYAKENDGIEPRYIKNPDNWLASIDPEEEVFVTVRYEREGEVV